MKKVACVLDKLGSLRVKTGPMTHRVRDEWAVVGERLALIEKALGMNGNRMAAELGINRQRWSTYKIGQRELPVSLAGEMRRRWGCALDWIYLGEEYHNAESFKQRLAEARSKAARGRVSRPPSQDTRSKGDGPSRS